MSLQLFTTCGRSLVVNCPYILRAPAPPTTCSWVCTPCTNPFLIADTEQDYSHDSYGRIYDLDADGPSKNALPYSKATKPKTWAGSVATNASLADW